MNHFFHRFFCWLGIHGPYSYGLHSTYRSHYLGPRLRQCCACRKTWLAGGEDESMRPTGWTEIN